jgi:hypothetical protein
MNERLAGAMHDGKAQAVRRNDVEIGPRQPGFSLVGLQQDLGFFENRADPLALIDHPLKPRPLFRLTPNEMEHSPGRLRPLTRLNLAAHENSSLRSNQGEPIGHVCVELPAISQLLLSHNAAALLSMTVRDSAARGLKGETRVRERKMGIRAKPIALRPRFGFRCPVFAASATSSISFCGGASADPATLRSAFATWLHSICGWAGTQARAVLCSTWSALPSTRLAKKSFANEAMRALGAVARTAAWKSARNTACSVVLARPGLAFGSGVDSSHLQVPLNVRTGEVHEMEAEN